MAGSRDELFERIMAIEILLVVAPKGDLVKRAKVKRIKGSP